MITCVKCQLINFYFSIQDTGFLLQDCVTVVSMNPLQQESMSMMTIHSHPFLQAPGNVAKINKLFVAKFNKLFATIPCVGIKSNHKYFSCLAL